jgi:hypothetical protein
MVRREALNPSVLRNRQKTASSILWRAGTTAKTTNTDPHDNTAQRLLVAVNREYVACDQ